MLNCFKAFKIDFRASGDIWTFFDLQNRIFIGVVCLGCYARAQIVGFLPFGNGLEDTVRAIAAVNGSIFAGGTGVHRFDGVSWTEIAGVATTSIVASNEGGIVVGGAFSEVGGIDANNVALWDGEQWANLGGGVGGRVNAVVFSGGDLVVGGEFEEVGDGVIASFVAAWDGSEWRALGNGLDFIVECLESDGEGGVFAGGLFSGFLAHWNGNMWETVGGGLDGDVQALARQGSRLFIGGFFSKAGTENATNIAVWDGSSFKGLGEGVDNIVSSLAVLGDSVVVGGIFGKAGQVRANYLAVWNGEEFEALGVGMGDWVYVVETVGSDVIIGGRFLSAGGQLVNHVASTLSVVQSIGGGVDGDVNAVVPFGDGFVVGGDFGRVFGGGGGDGGGVNVSNIALWNGRKWKSFGEGLDGYVLALLKSLDGEGFYAAGVFSTAGKVVANNIAFWSGAEWSALGSGVGGQVMALAMLGSDVVLGGSFQTAGGKPLRNLARFTQDSEWVGFDDVSPDEAVAALAVVGETLFVGGQFDNIGNLSIVFLGRWTKEEGWTTVGDGPNGEILALAAMDGGKLCVGGSLSQAGGVPTKFVAMWDGSRWNRLGDGVGEQVNTLLFEVGGGNIFVGGDFLSAGDRTAEHAAMWDGSDWHPIGNGFKDQVMSIASNGAEVAFGGLFSDSMIRHLAVTHFRVPATQLAASLVTASSFLPTPPKLDTGVALAISIAVGVVVACVLSCATSYSVGFASLIKNIDFFTLGHYIPLGEPAVSKITPFGGSMTAAMIVTIIGVTVNAAVSFLNNDPVSSSGFIPESRVPTPQNASGFLEVAMVFQSPWYVPCPTPLLEASTPSWSLNPFPPLNSSTPKNTTCAYVIQCPDCSIQQSPVSVSLSVPYWFMWGSWATSARGASLQKGNNSYDILSGVWNRPTPNSFAETIAVEVSVTKDVQVRGNRVAGGFVTTLSGQTLQASRFGSSTTVSISFVPSGLVFLTSFEETSTAAVQAWSVIIGGAGGLIQVFRVLVPLIEWIWLWDLWRCGRGHRKSVSFHKVDYAESQLNPVVELPQHRHTISSNNL